MTFRRGAQVLPDLLHQMAIVIAHPEEEVFLCKRMDLPAGPEGRRAVYPARGPAASP